MDIPGINDFNEGMHQQLIHDMENAAQDAQHQHDMHAAPTPLDHHDPFQDHDTQDMHHHEIGGIHVDDHHRDEPSILDDLIPAAIKGMAIATVRFAAEMATDAFLSQACLGNAAHSHDTHHPLQVGSPDGEGFTHQTTGFTCAVVSQQMILQQFNLIDPQTGQPLSETRLTYDATANGWLTDHGTKMDDLGKLLDLYGVANHQGHDWPHLVHDLAEGHQVVMGVNADTLWHEHAPLMDLMHLFGNSLNHAIVIKGLRVDDHGKVVVVVNDPGQSEGAGVEYPLEHFQSAVNSSNLHYVATDHAPSDWSPAPEIRALSHESSASSHGWGADHADHDKSAAFADTISHMDDDERTQFMREI